MKNRNGLAELFKYKEAGQPVLSVYLETDLAHHSKDQVRLTLSQLLEEYDDAAMHKEAVRAQKFLAREYDWASKGLALFSAGKFWRVLQLPVRPTNFATVADKPYIRPLTDWALGERIGIAVVDRANARYFVSQEGEIEQIARIWRATPSRHKKGGENTASRIQRHADVVISQNLKQAAAQGVELFAAEKCTRLMLGGQEEQVAIFRSHLPKAWQNHVYGEFKIAVDATPAQVQSKINDLIEAANHARESAFVEQLAGAAKKRAPTGALGLADTLNGLEERRVMTLIVAEDFRAKGFECENCGHLSAELLKACPVCGHKMLPVNHAIDLAIRKAMEMDSAVVIARGEAAMKLKRLGGVGALFRY